MSDCDNMENIDDDLGDDGEYDIDAANEEALLAGSDYGEGNEYDYGEQTGGDDVLIINDDLELESEIQETLELHDSSPQVASTQHDASSYQMQFSHPSNDADTSAVEETNYEDDTDVDVSHQAAIESEDEDKGEEERDRFKSERSSTTVNIGNTRQKNANIPDSLDNIMPRDAVHQRSNQRNNNNNWRGNRRGGRGGVRPQQWGQQGIRPQSRPPFFQQQNQRGNQRFANFNLGRGTSAVGGPARFDRPPPAKKILINPHFRGNVQPQPLEPRLVWDTEPRPLMAPPVMPGGQNTYGQAPQPPPHLEQGSQFHRPEISNFNPPNQAPFYQEPFGNTANANQWPPQEQPTFSPAQHRPAFQSQPPPISPWIEGCQPITNVSEHFQSMFNEPNRFPNSRNEGDRYPPFHPEPDRFQPPRNEVDHYQPPRNEVDQYQLPRNEVDHYQPMRNETDRYQPQRNDDGRYMVHNENDRFQPIPQNPVYQNPPIQNQFQNLPVHHQSSIHATHNTHNPFQNNNLAVQNVNFQPPQHPSTSQHLQLPIQHTVQHQPFPQQHVQKSQQHFPSSRQFLTQRNHHQQQQEQQHQLPQQRISPQQPPQRFQPTKQEMRVRPLISMTPPRFTNPPPRLGLLPRPQLNLRHKRPSDVFVKPESKEQFRLPPKRVKRMPDLTNLHEVERVESISEMQRTNVTAVEDDEDEETQAYRLKIEEQKKLRQAVLQQKEERRVQAALEKQKQLQDIPKEGSGMAGGSASHLVEPLQGSAIATIVNREPNKPSLAPVAKMMKPANVQPTFSAPVKNPFLSLRSRAANPSAQPVNYPVPEKTRVVQQRVTVRPLQVLIEGTNQAGPSKQMAGVTAVRGGVPGRGGIRPRGVLRTAEELQLQEDLMRKKVAAGLLSGQLPNRAVANVPQQRLAIGQGSPRGRGNARTVMPRGSIQSAPTSQRIVRAPLPQRILGTRAATNVGALSLPRTKYVSIENLATSTTDHTLLGICQSVGPVESFEMVPSERRANVIFHNTQSAALFYSRYHRRIFDLSLISVNLHVDGEC